MGAKLPAIPRAEPSAGPVVQTAEQLPSATTKDLQGWFAQEEKHSAELSAWDEALRRVLEKRSAGIVLSTDELKFVARAFTAYSHIRMTAKRDAVSGVTLRQKNEISDVVPVKVPVVGQTALMQ